MIARGVTPVLVDTSAKLSRSEARALYQAGVRSLLRYVFFGPPRPGDLDAEELDVLNDEGHLVSVVQHVRNPGWIASLAQGDADGLVAAANAAKAGYPAAKGLSLALDMEGVRNTTGAISHVIAWCAPVRAAGYRPVIYVGYDSGLTSAQLDSLPDDVALWCDYAPMAMRADTKRGYALHQRPQSTMAGLSVDEDAILQPGVVVGWGPDLSVGS